MPKQIRKMTCSDLEKFISDGGEVNAVQMYEHPFWGLKTSRSLLGRSVEIGCVAQLRQLLIHGASLGHNRQEDFSIDVLWHGEPFGAWRMPLWVEDEDTIDDNCMLFLWSINFQNAEVCETLFDTFVISAEEKMFQKIMIAALTLAINVGNMKVLATLLERGGNKYLNEKESFWPTPFHNACLYDDPKMVHLLLERGANPNISNTGGDYPLTDAIASKYEEVALLLLEYGADVNIQLKDRGRPLSMAKKRKLKRVVQAIEQRLNNLANAPSST